MPENSSPEAPWWGRISLLWLMAVPVCAVLYTLALPLTPNDLWSHARAGSIIATTHHIPTTNLYASGVPLDTPYVYQSWLAEWIFYEILARGGAAWIVVLRSVCVGLAWAILVGIGYRRCLVTSPKNELSLETTTRAARCAAFSALLGFLMSASNMEARPQSFSIPLFALFIAALFAWPQLRPVQLRAATAGLVLAMVCWVNLHGAFIDGLLVITIYLASEAIVCLRGHNDLTRRRLMALAALLILCGAATLLNPKGYGIYPYVATVSGNPIIRQYVTEWQRPSFDEWHNAVFFLSPILLVIAAMGMRATTRDETKKSLRASEWITLLVLGAFAVTSARAIIWYAMYFTPALASCLFRALSKNAQAKIPVSPTPRFVYVMNAALAAMLCLPVIAMLPWLKPALPWPPAYQARFAPNPADAPGDPPYLLDRDTPVEAIEYLRSHPPHERLFCDMEYGAYVAWSLYPQILPSCDPRIELYPVDFWKRYFALGNGEIDGPTELARDHYGAILLDSTKQAGLLQQLRMSTQWTLVYDGKKISKAKIFFRKNT